LILGLDFRRKEFNENSSWTRRFDEEEYRVVDQKIGCANK